MLLNSAFHFVIGLCLSIFVFLCVKKESQKLFQIAGVFSIILCSYWFLYWHCPIGHIAWIIAAYLFPLAFCAFLLFFSSIQKAEFTAKRSRFSPLKIFSFSICNLLCIIILCAVPWATTTFPLNNAEAVIFTLLSPAGGAENFVWDSLEKDVLLKSSVLFTALILFQLLFTEIMYHRKSGWQFHLRFLHYSLLPANTRLPIFIKFQKISLTLMFLYVIWLLSIALPIKSYYKTYATIIKGPTDSPLYLKHYVFPDSTKLSFPPVKKNLLVIFMESMKTNFSPYTPELNRQEQKSITFSPGGANVSGTGWTIAAQIAKLCGIPLMLPTNPNDGELSSLVPYAKCLTDILAGKGYSQTYIQGSDAAFAAKKNFWEKHGGVEVRDLKYYEQAKRFAPEKEAFWGFDDVQLYQFIKDDISEISKDTAKPFAIYAITVDTHVPYGHLSPQCGLQSVKREEQYPLVLRCASLQIDNFLNWAKNQSWYKNTTIVIMGDHVTGILSPRAKISLGGQLYWIDLFINSEKAPTNTLRNFSSFDMFPTILEAMGVQLDGQALGLGVSLFADKPTLLETYPQRILDSLLSQKNNQYNYFLYGGSVKNKLKAHF